MSTDKLDLAAGKLMNSTVLPKADHTLYLVWIPIEKGVDRRWVDENNTENKGQGKVHLGWAIGAMLSNMVAPI